MEEDFNHKKKRILIPLIGPWLDKGESAMLVAMLNAIRSSLPESEIAISASTFPLEAVDKRRYSEYGIKVKPGLISSFLGLIDRLPGKNKTLKSLVGLAFFLGSILGNLLWLFYYKCTHRDSLYLAGSNHEIISEYKNADWILFCGGQNIVQVIPFPLPTFIALYEILFAKALQKPVMIYANTLGPFNFRWAWPLIRWALNKVDLITTREEISKEILKDIEIESPTFVTADAAFLTPTISSKEARQLIEKGAGISGEKIMIGLTAIPWHFPKEKSAKKRAKLYNNYLEVLAQTADYIIEKWDAYIIFFPQVMVPHKKDDTQVYPKILDKIQHKSQVKILTADYTPEELQGMYGCMELLLGTRFHSCILALSRAVPTIAIEYSGHKSTGIMKLLGLEEHVYKIETLTTPELIAEVEKTWKNKEKIRSKIRENVQKMKKRSMENIILAQQYLDP